MNGGGKSDRPIVPAKPPNNGGGDRLDPRRPEPPPAEAVEGRGLAKENPLRQNQPIGPRAAPGWQNALERIVRRHAGIGMHPYPNERLCVNIQGKSRMR